MPFVAGESGNPGGRPRGSQNKAKKDLREAITQFLLDNFEKVQEEFDKLEGAEKVKYYCQLLPYGLAKIKPEVEPNLNRLTEEEMDELFEKLKNVVLQRFERPGYEKAVHGRSAEG
jgi:hypothetical protein